LIVRRVLAVGLIGSVGLLSGSAWAAAPATIVVTGLPAPRALATLPGSTAVLATAEIDRIGAHHPAEALGRLPGVLIHRGSGMEHLTAIRSPVLTGGAGAGSFLFLEDGIALRAAGFANVNELFDAHTELARAIEVVRGPGGALYGSNAEHGLINILSRGPGDAPFTQVSAGSFGRAAARTFLAHGSEGHGDSLALTLNHEGGYRAASGLDQQKATLRHEWSAGALRQRVTLSVMNLNQETAGYVVGPGAYKLTALARGNLNPEAYRDARNGRLVYLIERDRGGGGTDSLTLYARATDMEFLQHFNPSRALEKNWDWSFGLRARRTLELHAGHEIAFGLDGEYTVGALKEIQSLASFGTFPTGVHYDYVIEAAVLAPYIHTEWKLGERTQLSAGARYEITRYDYDTHTPQGTIGRFKRPADRIDTYGAFTPNVALSYVVAPDWFAYARAARGARAPQTSDAYRLQNLQTVGGIDIETLDALEAGLRGRVGGAQLELAVYAMEKRSFFFRDADGFNVTDGRTSHRGVELSLNMPLGETLSFAGSASTARHTYRFDRPVSATATEAITSGADIDTAPRLLGDAALLWQPSASFEAEIAWNHVGRYFTDAANAHTYPGHQVFDLRVAWKPALGLEVKIAVRNLANTNYAERADYAFGQERYFPGETRGLELALRAML
jgi:outer membrane receptor protein involved in Fe transport